MNKRLYVNPLAIFFHPRFDELNQYRIYIYNSVDDKFRKINPAAYWILKTLDECNEQGLLLDELIDKLKKRSQLKNKIIDKQTVKIFIQEMIIDHVIFEL